MAKNQNHPAEHSKVPVLIAPREEAVIDGRKVTFSWKPAEEAVEYRLQIASDTSFDDLVYDEAVGRKTQVVVEGVTPIDEDTYFWRVLAEEEDGSVHGADNIESFISGTASDEARHMASPDQEEALGPVAQLARAAKAEAAAEITHAPKYVEEEAELGVEHEGVEAGEILGLTLAVAVALAFSIVALFQYVDITAQAARYEVAGVSGYPDLRENRFKATQKLSQYGAVEGAEDRYTIPIDRAIELMANEAYQTQEERRYSDELILLPQE